MQLLQPSEPFDAQGFDSTPQENKQALSPERPRPAKKASEFSCRLDSSDNMRATFTHTPEHLTRRRKSFTALVHKDHDLFPTNIVSRPQSSLASRLGSRVFNDRARSLPPADIMARSQSQSCLSPILRGDGLPDEKIKRLRGLGEAIGRRGWASLGIPWRQIPSHDRTGMVKETGDPFGSPESKKKEAGGQSKKAAQCSGKLGGSQGMKELLSSLDNSPKAMEPSMRRSTSADPQLLHLRRNLFGGDGQEAPRQRPPQRSLGHTGSTKDSCPFFCEETVPKCPTSVEYGVAEKVIEARRDYRAFHDNPELDKLTSEIPFLRKSKSSLRTASPQNPHHLSSQTVTSLGNVMHSIRPRPSGGQYKRWK